METISECIRKYVEAHDNEVTSCEVVNYILEEKKFETTEQSIRNKLTSKGSWWKIKTFTTLCGIDTRRNNEIFKE